MDDRGRPVPELPVGSPDWMRRAFAEMPRTSLLEVDGAAVEVLEWGETSGPAIVLVHGQAAHADWWRFIAPQLLAAGRVVALSLSGMGGSDWRDHYGVDRHARDVVAVARMMGLLDASSRSIFVGHSYGAMVLLAASAILGDAIGALYLIDYYTPAPGIAPLVPPVRKPRRYESLDEALARFRLSPEQSCENTALLDFIARRSLRRVITADDDFWRWCGDPRTVRQVDHAPIQKIFSGFRRPLAVLRGERSQLMDPAVSAFVRQIAPPHSRYFEVPDADHHVLLDQPLALVAALRALIAADGPAR